MVKSLDFGGYLDKKVKKRGGGDCCVACPSDRAVRILDPMCGRGALLLEAAERFTAWRTAQECRSFHDPPFLEAIGNDRCGEQLAGFEGNVRASFGAEALLPGSSDEYRPKKQEGKRMPMMYRFSALQKDMLNAESLDAAIEPASVDCNPKPLNHLSSMNEHTKLADSPDRMEEQCNGKPQNPKPGHKS